ncbi:hypothetical protein D3C81_1951870 [compost metagenome]
MMEPVVLAVAWLSSAAHPMEVAYAAPNGITKGMPTNALGNVKFDAAADMNRGPNAMVA